MTAGAITLSIDSTLADVGLVGRAVRAICRTLPGGARAAAEVELCVVEAVNNAIEHGYRGERGHRVDVHLAVHEAELRIEVVDRGGGARGGLRCATRAAAPDPLDESGRGLFLMQALMDDVSYRREGGRSVLRLTRRLAPRRRRPRAVAAAQVSSGRV